jgi:hypothetical protein
MSKSPYTGERSASRLKLAHLPKPPPRLRLGGMEPSEDMPAGEYKIICEGAAKRSFARGTRIELKYRVIDGPHAGTALRQWITVDATGSISPKSRYAMQCGIALGRPLEPEDDVDSPASIFSGQIFLACVGFRKTDKARGGPPTPTTPCGAKTRRTACGFTTCLPAMSCDGGGGDVPSTCQWSCIHVD